MKEIIDCHTHCNFSHDSTAPARDMIEGALAKGLSYFAITDHCDKDCEVLPGYEYIRQIDLPRRFEEIVRLRDEYRGRLDVAVGIEYGWLAAADQLYIEINKQYETDIVINSVHLVSGEDCYFAPFFDKRTRREAYTEYLQDVSASVDAPYDYDVIGHIGYVIRKAPYDDKVMRYADYSDLLDEILRKLIAKGKALELNSHAEGTGLDFLPEPDTLLRYRELGGELVTFGSDAHSPENIARNFGLVREALKAAGFKYLFKYKAHSPIAIKLD